MFNNNNGVVRHYIIYIFNDDARRLVPTWVGYIQCLWYKGWDDLGIISNSYLYVYVLDDSPITCLDNYLRKQE